MNKTVTDRSLYNLEKLAAERNENVFLYCTECCTSFVLKPNGNWTASTKNGEKVADLVANRMLVCTCGTPIGVIAETVYAPGMVVPVQ